MGDNKYHMVIGKNELTRGSYYWELKIEGVTLLENVMVGIANDKITLGENPVTG